MDKNDFGLKQWDLTNAEPEPPKELTSYQKLFWAILMDAIETLKKPTAHVINRYIGLRHYKVRDRVKPLDPVADAWNWILSDDDGYALGFVAICQYFKWNHTVIRQKALEAIQKAKEHPEGRRNLVATDGKRRRKWA